MCARKSLGASRFNGWQPLDSGRKRRRRRRRSAVSRDFFVFNTPENISLDGYRPRGGVLTLGRSRNVRVHGDVGTCERVAASASAAEILLTLFPANLL